MWRSRVGLKSNKNEKEENRIYRRNWATLEGESYTFTNLYTNKIQDLPANLRQPDSLSIVFIIHSFSFFHWWLIYTNQIRYQYCFHYLPGMTIKSWLNAMRRAKFCSSKARLILVTWLPTCVSKSELVTWTIVSNFTNTAYFNRTTIITNNEARCLPTMPNRVVAKLQNWPEFHAVIEKRSNDRVLQNFGKFRFPRHDCGARERFSTSEHFGFLNSLSSSY